MNQLNPILELMKPISLEEMKAVQLMNRVDTKYITTIKDLPILFEKLKEDYYAQNIMDHTIAPYKTLYYDTEDVKMYTAHHNRKLCRQKIRIRSYRQSETTFCEIKNKNNKRKTNKMRILIPSNNFYDSLTLPVVIDFLQNNLLIDNKLLIPQVENSFSRITLVNKEKTERITIDSGIKFKNHYTNNTFDISDLVVIELKQEGFAPSLLRSTLQDMRIIPQKISKYCIGTILTNPEAKYNRFKKKRHYIEKLLSTV